MYPRWLNHACGLSRCVHSPDRFPCSCPSLPEVIIFVLIYSFKRCAGTDQRQYRNIIHVLTQNFLRGEPTDGVQPIVLPGSPESVQVCGILPVCPGETREGEQFLS